MIRSYAKLGPRAVVVGGGPVGAASAVVLRHRGFEVDIFERFEDLRKTQWNARRSINLVLGRRGLRLADSLGLRDDLLKEAVPVHGRMMHTADRAQHYQPYGHGHECNYAVARGRLNAFWLDAAAKAGANLHFSRMLQDFDLDAGTASFSHSGGATTAVDRRLDVIVEGDKSGQLEKVEGIDLLLACDGAGSKVRTLLETRSPLGWKSDFVTWGYKEITFPKSASEGLSPQALHIWPRGKHFLMALANPDGSFTGTMYADSELPFPDGTLPDLSDGPTFQNTSSGPAARAFFEEHYPDVLERLGEEGLREYRENPAGVLGNVRLDEYHHSGKRTSVVLAGDSAHAVVPFFGQGVQSGFEDAFVLGQLLNEYRDGPIADVAAAYSQSRVRSCHALREMALDNMLEMGDRVGQDHFRFLKQLESRIETELANKYRSRYALVCYSYNDYADVYEVGKLQHKFLEDVATGVSRPDEVSMSQVEAMIDERLTPEFHRRGMSLDLGEPH